MSLKLAILSTFCHFPSYLCALVKKLLSRRGGTRKVALGEGGLAKNDSVAIGETYRYFTLRSQSTGKNIQVAENGGYSISTITEKLLGSDGVVTDVVGVVD